MRSRVDPNTVELPALPDCPPEYMMGTDHHERARWRLAYQIGVREQQLRHALARVAELERGWRR